MDNDPAKDPLTHTEQLLAQVRLAALKDAARDMCIYCHGAIDINTVPTGDSDSWHHFLIGYPNTYCGVCHAGLIWSRIAREFGEGEVK